MRDFLSGLAETGIVSVPGAGVLAERERGDVREAIRAADAVARADAPGDAPPLEDDVAAWAASVLFRAACCLADRTVDAAAVSRLLRVPAPPPGPSAPAGCWSADVFLRHLPALHGLAKGLAPDDPLVREIERIAVEWPLSSVGIALPAAPTVPPAVAAHPSLRALYVDRVIARADVARLAEPWVAERARAALAAHPRLAPAVAVAVGMLRREDAGPAASAPGRHGG